MKFLAWDDLPREIEVHDRVTIPMSDGCELAATIWMPKDAVEDPVPAILEYIPYRKNDATSGGDVLRHPYFAGHGYASVRVDIRGSGDSDGILWDEYLEQEQDDALEVLAWLAEQDWCTGSTGMIGISWGGFSGLQVAARQPEELKAIITIASTDDRYETDVHYMGGCVLATEMLSWATTMLINNARPPDPETYGDRWRETWEERLRATPPFVETWLSHQRRDDYWKHGSVCEDYEAIRCPVFAVGGWLDPYHDAVFRLLAGLSAPSKGLIGPWIHVFPHLGRPGPAIGFLQECLRWWDHWLKGHETGIMDEPKLQVWMQEFVQPAPQYEYRPGRWVAARDPGQNADALERTFYPAVNGHLDEDPPACEGEYSIVVSGLEETGTGAGCWVPETRGAYSAMSGYAPADQREDDARSCSFTTDPLEEPVEVVGFPELRLQVTSDQSVALLAVRLCEIAPDGSSLLVTRGVLNLTHRNGHSEPQPLVPGEELDVSLRLNSTAHSFRPGHRIRISVSPTYWPWAWPSPRTPNIELSLGTGTRLGLPLHTVEPDEAPPPRQYAEPEAAQPLATRVLREGATRRETHTDVGAGKHEVRWTDSPGDHRVFIDRGIEYATSVTDRYSITEGDPLSASVTCDWELTMSRAHWKIRLEASSTMTCNDEKFFVTNKLVAFEGQSTIFADARSIEIDRDLV